MRYKGKKKGFRELEEYKNEAVLSKTSWFLKIFILIIGLAAFVYTSVPNSFFIAKNSCTGKILEIQTTHRAYRGFNVLWGFEGLRSFSVYLPGLLFLIVLLLITLEDVEIPSLEFKVEQKLLYVSLLILAPCFFYVFRVSHSTNLLFGDGGALEGFMNHGGDIPSELLTCYIFRVIKRCISVFEPQSGMLNALILTPCIFGGVFLAALFFMAQTLGENKTEKVLLFLCLAVSGYTLQFFGYVESTFLEMVFTATYLAFSAKSILSDNKKFVNVWTVLAFISLSFTTMLHVAGILLIPSCGVLMIDKKNGTIIAKFKSIFKKKKLVLFFLLVLLPYILILAPFLLVGNYGNMAGGGDGVMFVPLAIDCVNKSKYVYYSMFSMLHFADIMSAILIAAPMSIPLILASVFVKLKCSVKFSYKEGKVIQLLALAAAGCALVPLIWNHDFGMWGDWNLATCYLFPLNIFAWVFFMMVMRQCKQGGNYTYTGIATSSIFIQMITALGIWGIFL